MKKDGCYIVFTVFGIKCRIFSLQLAMEELQKQMKELQNSCKNYQEDISRQEECNYQALREDFSSKWKRLEILLDNEIGSGEKQGYYAQPVLQEERRGNIEKVIYAADNRNRVNWGCRATSAALSALISRKYEIIHTITGRYTIGQMIKTPFVFHNEVEWDFISEKLEESVEKLREAVITNPELEELNIANYEFDTLVINGEGSMIMTTPPRKDTLIYLMLAWWAVSLGKKVYFVNAMFSDDPTGSRNERIVTLSETILCQCEKVITRDRTSLDYIEKYMAKCTQAQWRPDALFTWRKVVQNAKRVFTDIRYGMPFGQENDYKLSGFDLTKPYICISGGSLAASSQPHARESYTHFIHYLKEHLDVPVCLAATCDGDKFLRDAARDTDTYFVPADVPILAGAALLANASVFVSGRYHPAILASLGGTPCIFFKSNSHKTVSLQDTLEYQNVKEYAAFPAQEEYSDILERIKELLLAGDTERQRISMITEDLEKQAEMIFYESTGGR